MPLVAAARWAGVSTKTLARWLKQGLPYHQGSQRGIRLVRLEDIERFLQRHQASESRDDLNRMVEQTLVELSGSEMRRRK